MKLENRSKHMKRCLRYMIKKILITGVNSGVGFYLAKKLSRKFKIIGLSRSNNNIKKINSKNFSFNKVDLSRVEEIDSLKKTKNIDCLINNASIFKQKDFKNLTTAEILSIIQTNLIGTILLTRKILKENNLKKIINIISVSGLNGIKNQSIYSSSKHGLKGFFESLNYEIGKKTKIYNIYPGGINTELWNNYKNIKNKKAKNFLNPNDIFSLVFFLINQNNNAIYKNIVLFPDNDFH